MNCLEFQNLIVIGIHGRLTAAQRDELDRHRAVCEECAALYERQAPLIGLREEAVKRHASVPLPDWERSWAAISEQALSRKRRPARLFASIPLWVPAAAAVLLVFVLGYIAGRGIFVDTTGPAPRTAALPPSGLPSPLTFAEYADNLKPVLANFINRSDIPVPEELRALERGIIRDMLAETRALKSLAAESGDPSRADLLLDLEFVLTSLANLTPGDTESAVHLERMIREKDVAPRLRELASHATI